MKRIVRNIWALGLFAALAALTLSGCMESHYYHHYHHHTRGWYDHRHQPYPAGVDFNVDVR